MNVTYTATISQIQFLIHLLPQHGYFKRIRSELEFYGRYAEKLMELAKKESESDAQADVRFSNLFYSGKQYDAYKQLLEDINSIFGESEISEEELAASKKKYKEFVTVANLQDQNPEKVTYHHV